MRNLLAFLAAAALTLIGVGWYLDWFHLQSVPGGSGHRSVTIDIAADVSRISVEESAVSTSKRLRRSYALSDSSLQSSRASVPMFR